MLKSFADLRSLNVPHIDQYFGVWAMEESRFRALYEHVNTVDLAAHMRAAKDDKLYGDGPELTQWQNVAIIDIAGSIMKYRSSMLGGTSSIEARRILRQVTRADEIGAIMLRIDSPGGTVSGTPDLAQDVAKAAQVKPTHAYIEDMGASAAYWIASQATKVYANSAALVGSVGVFTVLEDFSEQAADMGVKVHVLRTGAFKGRTVPGIEIGGDYLAEAQRVIDTIGDEFVSAVANGRGISTEKARELADGRVHIASEAAKLGFIDGVKSFDEALQELAGNAGDGSRYGVAWSEPIHGTVEEIVVENTKPEPKADNQRGDTMSDQGAQVAEAATYNEIIKACGGAEPAFICQQLEAEATADQARDAWIAEQNKRLEAARTDAQEAKTAAEAAKAVGGVEPLGIDGDGGQDAGTGSATDRWNEAIAAGKARGLTNAKAVKAAYKSDPDLHAAYLAEHNAAHGRRVQ